MQSFVSIIVGFIWHIMCSSSVKWSRNGKGSVLVFSVVPSIYMMLTLISF